MEKLFIPSIRDSFTDYNGVNYCLVREIAFKTGELILKWGNLVAQTEHEKNYFLGESGNSILSVYVYQTISNPNVAYRIYQEYADYGFNGYGDDLLIQKLQERASKIKLSEFPTGVVTLNGKIIGQEIPFYANSDTLLEYAKRNPKLSNMVKIYEEILNILKEMYDNGVLYIDNHYKNYMISGTSENIRVNVIDFDERFVKFDDYSKYNVESVFRNFCSMINNVNHILQINDKIGKFLRTNNFDETFEQISEMSKKLQKK